MKDSKFWFVTLCFLMVIANVNGMSMPLRIAIISNAIVVLMGIVAKLRRSIGDKE